MRNRSLVKLQELIQYVFYRFMIANNHHHGLFWQELLSKVEDLREEKYYNNEKR